MKIIEQITEIGSLMVTTETSNSGKKSFCIQNKEGDMLTHILYQDEINMNDLLTALSYVINFFKQ